MNEVVSHGCLHQTVWVARVMFANPFQVWSTWFGCNLYVSLHLDFFFRNAASFSDPNNVTWCPLIAPTKLISHFSVIVPLYLFLSDMTRLLIRIHCALCLALRVL